MARKASVIVGILMGLLLTAGAASAAKVVRDETVHLAFGGSIDEERTLCGVTDTGSVEIDVTGRWVEYENGRVTRTIHATGLVRDSAGEPLATLQASSRGDGPLEDGVTTDRGRLEARCVSDGSRGFLCVIHTAARHVDGAPEWSIANVDGPSCPLRMHQRETHDGGCEGDCVPGPRPLLALAGLGAGALVLRSRRR